MCFRPLLGFFIFRIETLYAQLISDPFPSPIGVLYISIADYKSWGVKFGFPSPIGVLYISIGKNESNRHQFTVSVPYWGSLYFNAYELFIT